MTLPDLASRALGGGVVAANDELFAEKENLVLPGEPTHSPGTFGAKGQVYDGWETRRRRTPGNDWAMVRLGVPGVVRQVVVDTSHFTGNYPPACSVEGCRVDGYPSPEELEAADWFTLVPRSPLAGDTQNMFDAKATGVCTHVRLSLYPDGGVARLRVHGDPVPDPRPFAGMPIDLAAITNGCRVVATSNRFYGKPENLLMPGVARVMGEGWETARRRDDSHDWVTLRLAGHGRVRVVEMDTTHFVGNAPGSAALRGANLGTEDDPAVTHGAGMSDAEWFDLLPERRLQPDTPHRFVVYAKDPVTHVRLDVFPDGGMARLRCYGTLTKTGYSSILERWSRSAE